MTPFIKISLNIFSRQNVIIQNFRAIYCEVFHDIEVVKLDNF